MDRLNIDYINSLPHPLYIRFYGDKIKRLLIDIDAETGLLRFNVCGKCPKSPIEEVAEFIDANGISYDPDSFYTNDKKLEAQNDRK